MPISSLLNVITRTRKTIGSRELHDRLPLISIAPLPGNKFSVKYPNSPFSDPQRKYKEIARYKLISNFITSEYTVLDFGSGSFYGAAMMAKKAKHVIGIETSKFSVYQAKLAWRGIKNLICAQDSTASRLRWSNLDTITAINVIEHMAETDAFLLLTELKNRLRPDGLLFLATPRNRGAVENPDHKKEYNEEELSKLTYEAGFQIIDKYIQTMTEIKPGGEKDVDPSERAWFLWILK